MNQRNKRPLVNKPIEQFLVPILQAYANSGIHLTFNKVDAATGTLYLNIDKKRCKG